MVVWTFREETNINYAHLPQRCYFGIFSKSMANHIARVSIIPLFNTQCVAHYKLLRTLHVNLKADL